MKIFAGIMTLFFFLYLSTPSILVLIEKDADISLFYNMSPEEEIQKDLKEIKADMVYTVGFELSTVIAVTNSKIISENLSRHDNVSEEIFLPPPELI